MLRQIKTVKNQKGFSVVEVSLLSLILIVLVFLTVFVVRQNQRATVQNNQEQKTSAKGVEAITAKGLEEELKIEDQQASKEANLASDEIKASGDLEGAYEAGF